MIDGGMRDKLEPGTVLIGRYRGTEYRATVIAGEDGKVRYELEDGRVFRSPSAAASAVMNGQAANGWRWWNLPGDTPEQDAKTAPVKATKARKPKATADRVESAVSEEGTEATTAE